MFTEFMIELFYSGAKPENMRIASYVTVFATPLSDKMADQKTELWPRGVYIDHQTVFPKHFADWLIGQPI